MRLLLIVGTSFCTFPWLNWPMFISDNVLAYSKSRNTDPPVMIS
jgi:hypothetical protein